MTRIACIRIPGENAIHTICLPEAASDTPLLYEQELLIKLDQCIAALEAENERLREQVNLLMFRLDNLKWHPEFIHLEPQP